MATTSTLPEGSPAANDSPPLCNVQQEKRETRYHLEAQTPWSARVPIGKAQGYDTLEAARKAVDKNIAKYQSITITAQVECHRRKHTPQTKPYNGPAAPHRGDI